MPTAEETAVQLLARYPSQVSPTCRTGTSKNMEIITALRKQGAQLPIISRILFNEYHEKINAQSLGRHFRGDCRCPR